MIPLIRGAKKAGFEVGVVAPDREMSGSGMSISLHNDISLEKRWVDGELASALRGTPTDCVIIGSEYIYKHEIIEAVLSGVNAGANAGMGVLFNSGTLSAALYAGMNGFPSIAFSQNRDLHRIQDDDNMEILADHVSRILSDMLVERRFDGDATLNVNFPRNLKRDTDWVETVFSKSSMYSLGVTSSKSSYNGDTCKLQMKKSSAISWEDNDDMSVIFSKEQVSITSVKMKDFQSNLTQI